MQSNYRKNKNQRHRLGAIAPFVALMLPMLIALVVFGVDYGTISVAQHQLQNAADAGAISTLRAYQRDRFNGDPAAIESIGNNSLFGQAIAIDLVDDVEYGTWDAENNIFTPAAREGNNPPQGATAVRITLERVQEEGNGVNLLFAPVLGTEFADVRVQAVAATDPACSGFVGIESATLRNNIVTDSYDSTQGTVSPFSSVGRLGNGDVCSQGPVSLASGADVTGDIQGSPATIVPGSGSTVTGTLTSSPIDVDFPPVDFMEVTTNDNSFIERGPPWAPPFYNESTGDLVVNNGRNITLQSGVYHFRNLFLAGGSRLNIVGEVQIFIEGEMRFDNGTVANQTQIPSNLQIFVGDGPVNIQGGHQLHASIYAPEADVNIANGSGFFGSVIGRTFSVAGGAGLFYDESLASEAGGRARLVW